MNVVTPDLATTRAALGAQIVEAQRACAEALSDTQRALEERSLATQIARRALADALREEAAMRETIGIREQQRDRRVHEAEWELRETADPALRVFARELLEGRDAMRRGGSYLRVEALNIPSWARGEIVPPFLAAQRAVEAAVMDPAIIDASTFIHATRETLRSALLALYDRMLPNDAEKAEVS